MKNQSHIIIRGLHQNNLKNVSLDVPKGKIVVFTGVSGSGKSSIVFDTIAAESQRQMNETYTAFMRGRLPKYEKPKVDFIDNLSASVVIDQSRLGGNSRSTVGTISDMYAALRLLYARIGKPHIGTASYFSFNDPNGMCMTCSGLGKVMEVNMSAVLNEEKSWNEGMVQLGTFSPGNWHFNQYVESGLFDPNKKLKDYTDTERNLLLYGAYTQDGERVHKRVEGIHTHLTRVLLKRDTSSTSDMTQKRLETLVVEKKCPVCNGKRLNVAAQSVTINGRSIVELCEMEFVALRSVLEEITDPRGETIIEALKAGLTRMIDIGLPYLSMNRESASLSGGEAQRLKLVRYMGSALTGMTYIFDEPSTGMHPRDVHRMTKLLQSLRDKGNTVLVVEHDQDVIRIADEVVDVGPFAGIKGGQILFQGSYEALLKADTLTAQAMREVVQMKEKPRIPKAFLSIENANLHNLKNVSVDIPLGIMTVVTGVAGSGKSTLIRDVFAKKHANQVVLIDQSPVTATGRSTPATYLGFFDEIRKIMAEENQVAASIFSFNSKGACPVCEGRGMVITELVFMDPVTTTCESCEGTRYSEEAIGYLYKGKNIVEILDMTVEEALDFFEEHKKITKHLQAMRDAGLSYLSLGQPLSTLSGGERQRIKLAKHLNQKGNIYVLDEPTTGLHASDIKSMMKLLDGFVKRGNTMIIIEHNLDVMKQADYLIDIGPGGGSLGGEVLFTGTPKEMVEKADTITAKYLRRGCKEEV
ncbi:daunorubicin resistance protein DrrC [Sporanaerobium hydrogeniformans]|uniref:Daunorubicin resistance protein DrrC n=1 Tax=Sporanaerobium hydrogeniformans TaxID=3072179 RepID=A0AC61D9Y1_9FIRM|nr:excinuclease ABC subunit UvrA [Sporanaerobium hydrogeniformans]PHV69486.1 daunorubicin resistance protein DrrC [Sporanaerobium hydrogeniformans]